MLIYENECCDCATAAFPCLGDLCDRRRVPHYYCDNPECRAEERLYYKKGKELCAECILKEFNIVEGSGY